MPQLGQKVTGVVRRNFDSPAPRWKQKQKEEEVAMLKGHATTPPQLRK